MNSTNESEKEEYSAVLSTSEKIITVIFSSILLVGLFANLLFLWTFLTTKKLWNPHNALVVNLVFADLLIIGYVMPCNMVATILGYYPLPETLCFTNGILAYICFTVSIDSLMTIALNRYVKICKGHCYHDVYTAKTTFAMSIGCWILGCILVLPYALYKDGIIYDQTLQMCVFNRFMKGPYPIVSMVIAIPIPISITCVCYLGIYRHFQRVKGQLNRVTNKSMANLRFTQNIAVTRSCFVVFLTSLIAFTPFGVSSIFFDHPTQLPVPLHLFSILLCFANSAANSVIYGLMNRNMREGYKEKLTCFFKTNTVHSDDNIVESSTSQVPKTGASQFIAKTDGNSSNLETTNGEDGSLNNKPESASPNITYVKPALRHLTSLNGEEDSLPNSGTNGDIHCSTDA